jgi:hypothetical protein
MRLRVRLVLGGIEAAGQARNADANLRSPQRPMCPRRSWRRCLDRAKQAISRLLGHRRATAGFAPALLGWCHLKPFEPRVAACAARLRERSGPDALLARWPGSQTHGKTRPATTASRHAARHGRHRTVWPKAPSRSAWSRRPPRPDRALGPRWACRGHTRDTRALGYHRASEPRNGRVWRRVRLVSRGIEASAPRSLDALGISRSVSRGVGLAISRQPSLPDAAVGLTIQTTNRSSRPPPGQP